MITATSHRFFAQQTCQQRSVMLLGVDSAKEFLNGLIGTAFFGLAQMANTFHGYIFGLIHSITKHSGIALLRTQTQVQGRP